MPTDQIININTAAFWELEFLPGVGITRALAIADDRKNHGSFESVEDLKRVAGITPKILEKFIDRITV